MALNVTVEDVGHARRLARTVPASEFSGSPPVAVTLTITPSGSSGIELEHMERAVDPSRCATNVPLGLRGCLDLHTSNGSPWVALGQVEDATGTLSESTTALGCQSESTG